MKKKVLSTFLATVMVLSLAMCGTAGASDDPVTLRMAVWDYDIDGPTTYEPMIDAFEEANPDITIEVVNASSADYETKLTTMLAGGDDIDVFFAKSNTALPGLWAKGYCMDLTPMLEDDGFDMEPYGTVIEQQMTFDGDVYALPFRTNDWLLFYNKTIFDEAGVDYPTNDMTWEEVSDIAKQIVDNIDDDSIYGFSFSPKLGFIFPFLTEGEDDFDISTSDFSSTIKCLDWITDLVDYGAMEPYANAMSMSKDQTYFYNGEWAMMWNGSWFVQNMNDNADTIDFEWGIVNQPYFDGTGKTNFVTSTPLCISSNTDNPDEAYRFLTFMCGEDGASILATTNLVPGYMNDAVLDSYLENVDLDDDSIEALTNNKTHGFGVPTTTFSEIINAGQTEVELVLTDNEDAQQFVDNFLDQREEIFQNAE